MKTITYNPETHVLVPKGMMYELPELPMPIKGKFSKDLFDGVQMHQYAMRYLDEAIAAAPQPEPNPNWCAGCSPDNCSGCWNEHVVGIDQVHSDMIDAAPQPDRVAELEAETTKLKLDLLTSYEEAEELSGKVAELEAALRKAKEAIRALQCNTDDYYDSAREASKQGDEALAKINEVLK